MERSILPLATSVDGRQFTFQASLHGLQLQTGGYVVLEGEGERRLGQVLTMRPDSAAAPDLGLDDREVSTCIRFARGEGVILDGDGRPFHDAGSDPAEPAKSTHGWHAYVRTARRSTSESCCLRLGWRPTLTPEASTGTPSCAVSRDPGKTYSLGLVLERLLMGTSSAHGDPRSQLRLRPLVGGPRRRRPRSGRGHTGSRQRGSRSGRTIPEARTRSGCSSSNSIPAAQAASVRPGPDPRPRGVRRARGDPCRQRKGSPHGHPASMPCSASENPDIRRLGLRAANLGVFEWSIWSGGRGRSLVDELEQPTTRCLVIDLGSLDTLEEQRLISETVLSTLWRNRASRQPCLIVIDEAHNVCPAPRRRCHPARHELRIAHRRGRPQVRAVPADLDTAPAEGP